MEQRKLRDGTDWLSNQLQKLWNVFKELQYIFLTPWFSVLKERKPLGHLFVHVIWQCHKNVTKVKDGGTFFEILPSCLH